MAAQPSTSVDTSQQPEVAPIPSSPAKPASALAPSQPIKLRSPFKQFKNTVAVNRASIMHYNLQGSALERVWKFTDCGPKTDAEVIVCVPPVGGTYEMFFLQQLALSARGYRVIAVQYSSYRNHSTWAEGLDLLFDQLRVHSVHLFGVGLGGFLAQVYAAVRPDRVATLILCNSYASNASFSSFTAKTYDWMPEFMLKRFLLGKMPSDFLEAEIAESVDFAVETLESCTHRDLSSQLELNCATFTPKKFLPPERVLIIQAPDDSFNVKQPDASLANTYKDSKLATLKDGGPWCFISRAEEVNMHIMIHMRNHAEKQIVVGDQKKP